MEDFAAGIKTRLFEKEKQVWQSIFIAVKNSLIYIDDNIAELLHWSGRTLDMFDAGAIRIQSIDCGLSGSKDERKSVFISSSLLPGKGIEKIQKIVESSHFQFCTIFCTVTDGDMSLAFKRRTNVENESFYTKLKESVKFWMNHEHATVEIHHVPCVYANIVPGLFFMPSFSTFFPMLPSDLPTIMEWLRNKGDQRKFNSLSEVEIQHTPNIFQVRLKLLASALSSLFDELELNEDCYAIGHTSKLLAAELVNISSTKMKKSDNRCTVIFIDRTLDLVQGSSKSTSTSMADKIFELLPALPGHSLDVGIDMSTLISSTNSKNNILVPGSIAHSLLHKDAQDLFSSIVMENKKKCLSKIHTKLMNLLKEESISVPEENHIGNATSEKLSSLIKYFRNDMRLFVKHSAVLQVAMAVINTAEHHDNPKYEEIESTEKVLQLSLNEEDSPSCLSHILMLLKNVRDGERSYCLEDVFLLLIYIFSLVGDESSDSLQEESELQDTIVQDILSGTLKVKTKCIIDVNKDGQNVIKNKITGCFQKLSGLKHLRHNFTSFRDLFANTSSLHNLRSYESLVKQIIEKVFDPKKIEINDIEFKSTRLKDFIKSGFSLFMNVSKPHPSDHPVLFLFLVGGVTCSEVKQIHEYISSQNITSQIIIGSTKILNSRDILSHIFSNDNVLTMPYS
ncbi:sec1 family domain-containing protein 2-like [Dendronephthya gigantea]|uniref:sec1 family domain-containing protein 2-like n=1 Tax=Dendronephthya gigantea TaxID=151771 RepID=UPI001069C29B|nr:sec1 family domain-containing protein 2-like [Dendronephthya gigantea]